MSLLDAHAALAGKTAVVVGGAGGGGVLFLASDLARSITGTTLHIDGGTSAGLGFLDWPHGDGFVPAPLGGTLKRLFSDNG